jgi:hypothetical protein
LVKCLHCIVLQVTERETEGQLGGASATTVAPSFVSRTRVWALGAAGGSR